MTYAVKRPHHSVVVIGGGQAGLSMSYHLSAVGLDHVIFEKNRIADAWRSQRWDAFCLVTPNWQCQLPGFPYQGDDANGFMPRDEIVAYVESYANHIAAPVREGVCVTRLSRQAGESFLVETTEGDVRSDAVVLAVSGYHVPNIPRLAARLPETLTQIHSRDYRNPGQLPPGAVLVVGTTPMT